jgi:hypothetical protein
MSETTPEAPVEQTEQAPEAESETFDAEYVKKLRAEAAKYRTEAKQTAAELEKQRKASMSEAEKAVAEAEQRGRLAATTEFGQRLVRSDFVAAAARRNPEFDAASVLDDLNLARFVTDDGEPNADAISQGRRAAHPCRVRTPFRQRRPGPAGLKQRRRLQPGTSSGRRTGLTWTATPTSRGPRGPPTDEGEVVPIAYNNIMSRDQRVRR